MVVSGLELVNLCGTRKWNTQFHRKISNGKTGLPFQKFHFFRKFSSGTNRKIVFHLQPNRNFRNLLVNGKHPSLFHIIRFIAHSFCLVVSDLQEKVSPISKKKKRSTRRYLFPRKSSSFFVRSCDGEYKIIFYWSKCIQHQFLSDCRHQHGG